MLIRDLNSGWMFLDAIFVEYSCLLGVEVGETLQQLLLSEVVYSLERCVPVMMLWGVSL